MRAFLLIFLFIDLSYQNRFETTTIRPIIDQGTGCRDISPWCTYSLRFCSFSNYRKMCKKTCNLCEPGCRDISPRCTYSSRSCSFPYYRRICKKTCNLCEPVSKIATEVQSTQKPPGPESHPCERPCVEGEVMECAYNFTAERFKSMDTRFCGNCPFTKSDCLNEGCISADGVSRIVTVVNHQMPGPLINVCVGDIIKVNVRNRMLNGEGITIHWHGQFQNNSQWMDGVPMVTQCPIPLMSSMQYKFQAMPSGTHWWHSHVGTQRGDGFFGGIVVRQPKNKDDHSGFYDTDEHVIIIDDWFHQTALAQFYESEIEGVKDPKKYGLLINGRGIGKKFKFKNGSYETTPPSVFEVIKDKKHRFRLINSATSNCPMEISIDGHKLIAIASDGRDIKPVIVDSINSMNGERYDFLVYANKPIGNYWIRLKGSGSDCINYSQVAILRYKGAPISEPPRQNIFLGKPGSVLNPYKADGRTQYTITDLVSIKTTEFIPKDLSKNPDDVYFLKFGFAEDSNNNIKAYINHYSWVWADLPIMFKSKELNPNKLCYNGSFVQDNTKLKICTQRVKIPTNKSVDFVIYNEGTHPVHLHGGYYAVIAQIPLKGTTTLDNVRGQYFKHRESGEGFNVKNPPIKDTTMAKNGFFTVFRLRTWNPGYWLFHCHIDFHFKLGMALVFDFGADDEWAAPPAGFPDNCRSFPSNNNF